MLTIQSLEYLKQYREKRVKLIWFLPGNCIVLLESEYAIVIYTIRKYFQDFFWWQKFDNTLLCYGRNLHILNHKPHHWNLQNLWIMLFFSLSHFPYCSSLSISVFTLGISLCTNLAYTVVLIHHSTTSVDVLSVV